MLLKNLVFILLAGVFLVGCSNKPPEVTCPICETCEVCVDTECSYVGYIEVEKTNALINFTNTLIGQYNTCYNESLESLPKYPVGEVS